MLGGAETVHPVFHPFSWYVVCVLGSCARYSLRIINNSAVNVRCFRTAVDRVAVILPRIGLFLYAIYLTYTLNDIATGIQIFNDWFVSRFYSEICISILKFERQISAEISVYTCVGAKAFTVIPTIRMAAAKNNHQRKWFSLFQFRCSADTRVGREIFSSTTVHPKYLLPGLYLLPRTVYTWLVFIEIRTRNGNSASS